MVGFGLNFLDFQLLESPELKISIMPGLLFPLVIALVWGWRYGLLSALAGGCQTMWWLWRMDGWGILYSVPVFTLWIVWHGWWADRRRTLSSHAWYESAFAVEIPFRIVIELGFYTIFRWLVSFNPPPWNSAITWVYVPLSWVNIVATKCTISAYILIMIAYVIIDLGPIRRFFCLRSKSSHNDTTVIYIAAVLMWCLIWSLDAIIVYFVFNPLNKTFWEVFILAPESHEVFTRSLFLMVSLTGAVWIVNIADRRRQAEMALRESEKKYRALVEYLPTITYIAALDEAITTLYISPQIKKILNISSEKYESDPDDIWFEYLYDEDHKRVLEEVKCAHKNDQPFLSEYRMLSTDGRILWFRDEAVIIKDDNGTPLYRQGVMLDITKRKKTEKALRESEQFLNNIFESIQDGISVLNSDLTIRYVNGVINNWYSKSFPLEGKKCFRCYQNANEPCDPCPTLRCLKSGKTEMNIVHGPSESDVKWIELYSYPIKSNATGKITGAIEFVRNITKRKQMEDTLRESEKRFRSIFSNIPNIAVQGYDKNRKVTFWNKASETIYGYSRDEAIDKRLEELITPPEMREKVISSINDWHENNVYIPSSELVLIRKDKSPVQIYSNHVMIENANMEKEMFCIDIDITERKKAIAEREKLQAQLIQAQKMESVGRLAGGVAHDFNNMLGVILGHAEMAIGQINSSHPIFADLQEIRKAAERSADLTRQLLAFARKQTVDPRTLCLNETIEGMLKMLRRLIGEDIDLEWLPKAGIWPVKIDPSQMDQILVNLCVNARDAIFDVGKITIEIANIVLDETYCANHAGFVPGDFVLLAVRDNGCGMNKETLDKLFEPFFTTKELGKGTGLGLSTVYGAVKQNNGFINVYSELDQGTTFKIYLPRHAGKTTQIQKEKQATPIAHGDEVILLVEDEPAILEMTSIMLKHHGYTVLTASTPSEAISLAKTHADEIHLLMTDVVMPEMNGRDLSKQLLSSYSNLKCLFMSGYTANVIANHGVLDENINFIQKPFSMRDMTSKVREVLDGK